MAERRLTRRGSKRRQEILATSKHLFGEQGYHGTKVADICDSLGVGKGVFYWYFDSKEALFRELLESSLLELRRAQQGAIVNLRDPVLRIELGIRASIGFFRNNPDVLTLIRIAERYEQFQVLVARGMEVVVQDTITHLKEGMSRGTIRQGDPEVMGHGITGSIFHFVEVFLQGDHPDNPGLEDEAVRFCLQGVTTGGRR